MLFSSRAFSVRGGSPAERSFRLLAMMALFVIVGWAFWKNSERVARQMDERGNLRDETGLVGADDKAFLRGFASDLKSRFGLEFRLLVAESELSAPAPDSKTLFIGLVPSRRVALVQLPPLLRQALGQEFSLYLGEEHFTPYWEDGAWVYGLKGCLTLIWSRLVHLDAQAPAADPPPGDALPEPGPDRPKDSP